MPPWLPILADAGGWAVVVAMGFVLGLSFLRGWLVPRWLYDREVLRADRNDEKLETLTKAVEALTDEIRWDARDRHLVRRVKRDT